MLFISLGGLEPSSDDLLSTRCVEMAKIILVKRQIDRFPPAEMRGVWVFLAEEAERLAPIQNE